MSTRILIVDDHRITREGLRALLEKQAGFAVIGEADDGREAVEAVERLHPDIVIMDVTMPNLNGIEATRRILAVAPQARVIALSMHSDQRFVRQMFDSGASAYVLKDGAFDELAQAIRAVQSGDAYISARIASVIIRDFVRGTPPRGPAVSAQALSAREREVLQLIAEGKSTREIAALLSVGVKTVETHRRQIMIKLQMSSVADLTKYAIREGLT
ncbi:MAG: response regulator transcription factor, partial [Candidatus Eisenbacteria bacterium]|nr:response regulator transcription factor [Candidatus Eisenbacteria bacterium]